MALPTSGTITLKQLQAEFGGTAPTSLKEYYGRGGVNASGRLALKDFYGRSGGLLTFYPGDAPQTLYGNSYLAGNNLVNLQFSYTDTNDDTYSIRIENLGVYTNNVVNGTGDIFEVDNGSWLTNGTNAYIHEDHNDYLKTIFASSVNHGNLILNDTTNLFYGTTGVKVPTTTGTTYLWNSPEALRARSAKRVISPNGEISVNDTYTSGGSSSYSDWCNAAYGFEGKHWFRIFGYRLITYGRCWGSGNVTTYKLNQTNLKKFEISNF